MNDEETVALDRRRPHLRQGPRRGRRRAHVGPEPEGADIEEQGLGWTERYGTGKGVHTITSGLEGAWTPTPTKWDNSYFDTLFGFEWELTKSPAGAHQWKPKGDAAPAPCRTRMIRTKRHAPMMTTADLALRVDPAYEKISQRFHENPQASSPTRSRAPGSSSRTATWGRARATSARWCRRKS